MKKIHLIILLLLVSIFSLQARESNRNIPPSQENTYLFSILNYQRQPKLPSYMEKRIKEVIATPKANWNASDSLYYAFECVHLQKFGESLSFFSQLNTDTLTEPHSQILYRTTLYQLKRYLQLEEFNAKTLHETPDVFYNYKEAFSDLLHAYHAYQMDSFSLDSSTIFPILKAPILRSFSKNTPPNQNEFAQISYAIDSTFRQFSILHDKRDVILSKALEEMADFQADYLYLTNAYFYYGASLHYNKNNKRVIQKYNSTVNEMNEKNYVSIKFRNIFGKIIKNRYKLEDPVAVERRDSLGAEDFIPPPEKEKKPDYIPWVDTSVLVLLILAMMLLFVLLFVKAKE